MLESVWGNTCTSQPYFLEMYENKKQWDDLRIELKVMLNYELPKEFTVLHLCNLTMNNVQCKDRYLAKILLAAAKKAVTRKWHKEDPSSLRLWLEIVDEKYDMERLTHILRIQQSEFTKKWEKWTACKVLQRDTTVTPR